MAAPRFSWCPLSWAVAAILVMGSHTMARGKVKLNDGEEHRIDYSIDDSVEVGGNPGGTRATLLPGGLAIGNLGSVESSGSQGAVWDSGEAALAGGTKTDARPDGRQNQSRVLKS